MAQRLAAAGIFLCALFAAGVSVQAGSLSVVSDLISTSAPGAGATHTIQFTLAQAVPASGRIVITPDPDAFDILPSFDYTDVEFSVATSGPYVDQPLASAPNATQDGVAVTSGSSGAVTVTLNSTMGLSAGEKVRVTLAGGDPADYVENPSDTGSYRIQIETDDGSNIPIDTGTAMIAVVQQVGISNGVISIAPFRSNGLPSGSVAANNSTIEISLQTDIPATCRYATSTGIDYDSMTQQFTPNVGELFFTTLAGFQNGTEYDFYVRCDSTQGNENTDDYDISFTLDPTPTTDTSISTTDTSNGRGGFGAYANGSAVLYLGSVSIAGLTIPNGAVTILEDGAPGATATAKPDGSFTANVTGLERGTYSFDIYAADSGGRKTGSAGETLSVTSGSTNAISGVILPPTIGLATTTVPVGGSAEVSGESTPGSVVQVSVTGASGSATTYTASSSPATSTTSGAWAITIPAADLSQGTYQIKARTIEPDQSTSDYGEVLALGVGVAAPSDSATKSDLNGDGKVDLIDFSIMLANWGTSDAAADLNGDGTVGLADFSILLFNWTG